MASAGVMTASATAPKRRTARRWIFLTILCLAIHIGLIWFLEAPSARLRSVAKPAPTIQLLADPLLSEQLTCLPEVSDPASFALPTLQGFSGFAWLTFKALQPEFSPSITPAQWLELKEDDLANVFERLFPTNPVTTLQIADLPLPSLVGTVPQVTSEISMPPSSLRAEGVLAGRLLAANASLPPWPFTEVLSNTVLQALVDGEGNCVSSTILSGCGLKEADVFALKWARNCRFKPLHARDKGKNSDLLACGKLIFQWQTVGPSAPAPPGGTSARVP